jgi:UDP-N-acetylmuramate dehydrogenase
MSLSLPNLEKDVILAPYTTYKIGGTADYFIQVKNTDELVRAVKVARNENVPYFILGCGANILVRDKGFRGLVILNRAQSFAFQQETTLWAESGTIIADLIIASRDKSLSGLEHYVGIPSTVGGAMWQNLHFLSPDRTKTLYIASLVEKAEILSDQNRIEGVDASFFRFGYDDSILHHQQVVVLSVTFRLTPKKKSEIQEQMDANMAWRIAKQPQLSDYPSCGSVFKKIEGVGAGRLIDRAGLKGKRIGGAQISEKHANYIINLGHATASDVLNLINLAQLEVKRRFGYELEAEITIIGEE